MRENSRTVLVTSTKFDFAVPSEECRALLSLAAMDKAQAIGLPVISADAGSSPRYIEAARERGAMIFKASGKTLGAQRREAIARAQQLHPLCIVYSEIEKLPLIAEVPHIVEPILSGKAEMVVPRRQSLESYPSLQQRSEHIMNSHWQMLTGIPLDVSFGPRAWHASLSPLFLSYTGDYGDLWESIMIPVLDAVLSGHRVGEVVLNYRNPEEQTAIEEGSIDFLRKRIAQLNNVTSALDEHYRMHDQERKISVV